MNEVKEFFERIADSWDNKSDNLEIIGELFERININKNEDILDLGCGKGIVSPFIYKYSNKKVIGIDLSEKMIEGAKCNNSDTDKYEYICADYIDYKFDHKFDKIIIFNAFPHFLDKNALAEKCYYDLKDKGQLIIMHNLGKERLNTHHMENASKISCGLRTPEVESKEMNKYFKMIDCTDKSDRYLMVLEKK